PKPGVMDPVADSVLAALGDLGLTAAAVRTFRKFWIYDLAGEQIDRLTAKILANDVVEQVLRGPLALSRIALGAPTAFQLKHVPLRAAGDEELTQISRQMQLYLSPAEMQTIQRHFVELGRDPTDVELETLAQTWSEHC